MIGFNPYFALAGAIALVAAAAGGFVKGEDYARAKVDQSALKQLQRAIQDRDEKQGKIDVIDATGQQRENARQVEVREITREIPKIIERDKIVYDRTCIDADGVRLLDRAAAAAGGQDPVAPAGQTAAGAVDPAHN